VTDAERLPEVSPERRNRPSEVLLHISGYALKETGDENAL
jgi:hypothetical protein